MKKKKEVIEHKIQRTSALLFSFVSYSQDPAIAVFDRLYLFLGVVDTRSETRCGLFKSVVKTNARMDLLGSNTRCHHTVGYEGFAPPEMDGVRDQICTT